jgi:hypothetical protein
MDSIFDKLDKLHFKVWKFDLIGWISNPKGWRQYFLVVVMIATAAWFALGFDSTWGQLNVFWQDLPKFLTGSMTLEQIREASMYYYGIDNHFSAPVIYGIAFVILSYHFEKVGIHKSMNFLCSAILSLMNIGIFETMWNRSYAYFQNQPWAITFAPKQWTNLFSFYSWTAVGILTLLYLYTCRYKIEMNWKKWIVVFSAIGLWLLWIFYPVPAAHITVQTDWGPWTSSNMFPQTFYAVHLHNDGIAAGYPFYVPDYWVHMLNTLCKVVTTGAIMVICMMVPAKPKKVASTQ